jgi:hypothetical protein
MEHFARNHSKIMLPKSIFEVVATMHIQYGIFERQARRWYGPNIQCCWTKSGNRAVATPLAGASATELISWFNSCAANAPSARDSGSKGEQLIGITTSVGALKTL